MNPADEALLRKAYTAYNAQDVDTLLTLLGEDVDWPDAGDRLRGKAAVRLYWLEQWTRILTRDEPVAFARRPDGRIVVRISQVVHSVDGELVSTGHFDHVHLITDGRIRRLDIEAVEPA